MSGPSSERRRVWILMALAATARLPGLANKPLWYDEAFAVLFSATGPRAMAYGTLAAEQGIAADVHPLGYYTLLWAWTGLLGDSPLSVRLLSVVLGLATVYVGIRLAEEYLGRRAALACGLLLALGPFPVHYSQEVRMYALMALLLLGASWAFFRALDGGRGLHWAAFAALAAMAQYTHTLSAFYLAPLAAIALWRRRWNEIRSTLLAGAAAVALYLPWMLYLPSQLSRLRWAYWVTRPGPAELVRTWLVYVGGLPVYPVVLVVGLFGTVLATILVAVGALRALRAGDRSARWASWCLYLGVVPALLMFVFSYWQPVYLERALLASGLAFLLWLGWAVSRPQLGERYRWTAAAALAAAVAVGLWGSYSYRGFPYAPFSELAFKLRATDSGPRAVHSNKITALPTAYYDPQLELHYLADPPGSASDTLALATQQVLGMLADASIEQAAEGAERVAFVVFARELEDYRSLGYARHPALRWLDDHYRLSSTEAVGDLRIFHYDR